MQTARDKSGLPENKAAMTTAQRITDEVRRRKNVFAFDGAAVASGIARKLARAMAIANAHLFEPKHEKKFDSEERKIAASVNLFAIADKIVLIKNEKTQ